MKLALITDTHFGARSDSEGFHNFFEKFYLEQFFPYLVENGINEVIHLGDMFDRRKFINFVSLSRCRKYFFEPTRKHNIKVHAIIGNHDTSYKNTNEINSPDLLLKEYDNIIPYDVPTEVNIDGLEIALLPWICSGNYTDSMDFIESTRAQVLFGHLELAGFEMYRGAIIDHGFSGDIFSKFDLVMSGHFHHRSSRANIHYLGCPYEITWSDWNDPKGFHIFDTDTRELTFIENRYNMFHKVHYTDANDDMDSVLNLDTDKLKNTMVKVIVHEKNNPYWFDMFIDKIEKAGVLDLQVVEDNLNLNLEDDSDIIDEAEDTLTILRKYTDQFSERVDKSKLDNFLTDLYQEALSVE